jgi:hypothetical protein
VTNFMVGAMDNELLKLLVDDNIPTFAMQSNMTTHDFGWGTKNFHLMGRKKIALIRDFTLMGFDILVSDVDTVWMRDPIPYLQKYPEADVLTSSDHLAPTATVRNTIPLAFRHSLLLGRARWEPDDNVWSSWAVVWLLS